MEDLAGKSTVCIATFPSEVEAQLARTHLESNGIDSFISVDDCGGWQPWLQTYTGVRLMVQEDYAGRASGLLKAMEEGRP